MGNTELTTILARVDGGDDAAMRELIPLVYDDLRRRAAACMAGQPAGHTLEPTALVHEAYAKLVSGDGLGGWKSGRHFFNAAAEVMRQILVDHARRKSAEKRGGGRERVELGELAAGSESRGAMDWEALDGALAALKELDARRHRVVMLRYFAGLTEGQISECLEISPATVRRDWQTARVFLKARMGELAGF